MKKSLRYYRSYLIISLLSLMVFCLATCMDSNESESPAEATITDTMRMRYEDFAGSKACESCHKDIHDSHMKTAHFRTTALATEDAIEGSFEKGKNEYAFDERVVVKMEQRADGFYQVEYSGDTIKKERRMDIVTGSGTMGQSFLAWQNEHLFQMPITYFTAANQWSNSPGFPNRVIFNRVITSRCLECHSTFANVTTAPGKEPEKFDKNKFILGVDCEKCHGPAAKHVQFQTQHPQDTIAKFIINPASFNRQQKLDLCALCHGGRLQKLKPSFSYTPGDKLSDYFMVDTFPPRPEFIDVHGNQYGLLRASKCFKMSDMTCNTCHDTHKNEKGKTVLYSQRCMSCHGNLNAINSVTHKKLGAQVKTNCIDCHMPLQPSRAISVFLPGSKEPLSARIRSHFIK